MKVLLTGATGMVGRNLVEHPRATRHEWLVPSRRELDLRDQVAVAGFMRSNHVGAVVHAAGRVGGIQANLADPVGFLVENLDIGRNVLLAAADAGVERLINLGSSCMYPCDREVALTESDILTGPLEPTNEGYALAKITVAKLAMYLSDTRGLAFRTLIPCNLYGRHDKFDPFASHLLPAIIHKIHGAVVGGGDEVEIWGDGTARREFLYAGDLADAVLRALDNPETLPALMNIGLGRDYTINEYYRVVADVIGYAGRFVHDLARPVGMRRKLTDVSLAGSWGWQASTSLHDGVRATYQFYLENHKNQ